MRHVPILFSLILLYSSASYASGLGVSSEPVDGSFALVGDGVAAVLLVDPDEPAVVREVAAAALAQDVQRVTGREPVLRRAERWGRQRPAVIIGTVGQSDLIRELVESERLDITDLEGQWEAFKVVYLPGEDRAHADTLVIVGSDRRGTAFGVFEVSRAIGVSPWYWWADVPIQPRDALHLSTGGERVGPPSVKYRGIFLNDEDWGLQPWAAKTYEPETGDIGPKTYAAIFELLLRLKANYIWPAMHPSTRAFNFYPDNKRVADRYAIVMGSSHAEPMLRNNVDEWARDGSGEWNFVTNREAVLRYWDQRVAENGRYENVYTIGMRGIHDSGMVGGGSIQDQADRLEEIFAAQRGMLERHVGKPADQVPQVFVPYKEVLGIYRSGLEVPPDVTLGWIDDNYGYIRQLSNAQERARPGGSGVYYHLSYWGQPHDFLWIDSVPPGLTWEEMTKAYEYGAERLWVVNVGDIKPNELGMDWFLRLAWDTEAYGPGDAHRGLVDFFRENLGDDDARAIADVMSDYYHLNHIRKPEHMAWSTVYPTTGVQQSDLSHWAHGDEAQRRLDAFDDLQTRAEAIGKRLPNAYRDAYFQLVLYPVAGAADMNRKHIHAEKSRLLAQHGWPAANVYAQLAQAAHDRIQRNTQHYNEEIADGKWRGIMSAAPRGLAVFDMPPVGRVETEGGPGLAVRVEGKSVPAVAVDQPATDGNSTPKPIRLGVDDGRRAGGMERLDTTDGPAMSLPPGEGQQVQEADGDARATFDFHVEQAGRYTLRLEVRHPTDNDDSWHLRLDDNDTVTWNDNPTGDAWRWFEIGTYHLTAGRHRLTILAREDGAQLRRVEFVTPQTNHGANHPTLIQAPNRLPSLNRYTRRPAFIDLYNTGGGSVSWQARADQPWVQLSMDQGRFETHQRVRVGVDYDQAPRGDDTTATVEINSNGVSYRLIVPVRNPADDLEPGTFIRENNAVSIDAEHFVAKRPAGRGDAEWQVIAGVGYSNAVVGLMPRLLPEGPALEPGLSAPTLDYPLFLHEGGRATITLQALPTHEITAEHTLSCAVSFGDGPTHTLRFAHGNDERNTVWKRNVLRGAMAASLTVDDLPAGAHTLRVHGVDPSVVLDRIVISFEDAAPSYLGPRETRMPTPPQP